MTFVKLCDRTLQSIFDQVARHLLTQGSKSRDARTDMCFYRQDGGRKCAVGCLIPDELYTDEIEGCTVDELLFDHPEFSEKFGLEDGDEREQLLFDLQKTHDVCDVDSWLEKLEWIAGIHGLSPAVLEEFK